MKKLTIEQYTEYLADPMGCDAKLRQWCGIPEDKYYTVSIWPENRAGEVRINSNLHRIVKMPKISKSNQSQ